MRAEVKVATMLVQHNILLAVADALTPLFQDISLTVKSPRTIPLEEQKLALSMALLLLSSSRVLLNM
jgi:hypothetical protein